MDTSSKELPIALGQKRFRPDNPEREILNLFEPDQQRIIESRQQVLSSLALFIGKDFRIPVVIGLPDKQCPSGWKWQVNKDGTQFIQMNAEDLLEKPMDYLRFVTSHEGFHRRISRITNDVIPTEEWEQPGFSFMTNAIEDPRVNSFGAEAYPSFRKQMDMAYEMDRQLEEEAKLQSVEQLGTIPRFELAGFEYIRQWFRESRGEPFELSPDLPPEVAEVVRKTLRAARDSWLRYPTRHQADSGEGMIEQFARVSYEINRDEVWPEFRKLVDADIKDQEIQQAIQDGLPSDLKGEVGDPQDNDGKPVDLSTLSDELKQKIKDYIDSLSEEQKKELNEKAKKRIKDFEKNVNQGLEGKLVEQPDLETTDGNSSKVGEDELDDDPIEKSAEKPKLHRPSQSTENDPKLDEIRRTIEAILNKDENIYEQSRREMLPVINLLEQDLREIFVQRRAHQWTSGFRSGKRLDISKRIQEKAKRVSVVQSRAWERRELPTEKDYAISILVDLSGSMEGQKIAETFKGVVVLAEVLNRLSIPIEIFGFNDEQYEYQRFRTQMSADTRAQIGGMIEEIGKPNHHSAQTDTGWAMTEASERLARQPASEKFLIVLTDGQPYESPPHSGDDYELRSVVEKVTQESDQKVIGLGIGPGTGFVAEYFPNNLAHVKANEMGKMLADLIREVIAHYDEF